MSHKVDNSLARTVGQANSTDKCQNSEQDTPEELVRLQCQYYRNMNALLSQAAAKDLGWRLNLLAKGSFMPSSGTADLATICGLMNLDERTVYDQLKKTQHEKLGFGRRVYYSLAAWFLAKRLPEPRRTSKK